MGTEGLWIPAVMALVGAGVQTYNTRKTAKRQDRALADSINRSAEKGRKADETVRERITQTAQADPRALREERLAKYTGALKAGAGASSDGMAPVAGASDRFNQDIAEAALGVSKYGANRAGLQSTADSIGLLQQEEGYGRARTATELAMLDRSTRAQQFIDGLKIKSAGQRNPYLDAAGGVISGLGSTWGSSMGAAGSQAATAGAAGGDAFFRGGGLSGWGY